MAGAERGPVGHPLELALTDLGATARDAAAVALCRRYARDLDDAAVVSVGAARLVLDLERAGVDEALVDRVRALAARVEETAVLGLLGPKLQVALSELGLTPRARSEIVGKGGEKGGPPTDNPVARRRTERAGRLHSA